MSSISNWRANKLRLELFAISKNWRLSWRHIARQSSSKVQVPTSDGNNLRSSFFNRCMILIIDVPTATFWAHGLAKLIAESHLHRDWHARNRATTTFGELRETVSDGCRRVAADPECCSATRSCPLIV
jgi:hypothetical protein